jgi:hypothetical protein
MPEIPLTRGKVTIVDDVDYEFLMQWKWCAAKMGKSYRAQRSSRKNEGTPSRTVLMHRMIAERMIAERMIVERMGLGVSQIDHIDRDQSNNRRANLRVATYSQNCHNKSMRSDNTSGHIGVRWNKEKGKWHARVHHQRKSVHVGYFHSLILATYMRDKKKRELAGEFCPEEIKDA